MDSIYFDNNSTAPILPEVAEAMRACYERGYANPASQHHAGRRARNVLEEAREGIAEILGADVSRVEADRVVFTSGGTEANNLALRGLAGRRPGHLVISAIEHPSIVGTGEHLEALGWKIERLGVNGDGVVRASELASLLRDDTRLVSVMLANNETGVLQPVEQLAASCRDRADRVYFHTDAVQAVGKQPVHFRNLGVDALSCTAHKFHGPRGIGVLLLRHGVPLDPILFGGFQQAGLRPGSEPVALAVGMHAALRIWQGEMRERAERLAEMRDCLEAGLRSGWPGVVINGAAADRLPHTSNVAFPGLDRQALLMALDLAGVACSTGSACASGSSEPSPVLLAMGCEDAVVRGSLRLSVGCLNTPAEVDQAVGRILKVCHDLQQPKRPRKMGEPPPAGAAKAV